MHRRDFLYCLFLPAFDCGRSIAATIYDADQGPSGAPLSDESYTASVAFSFTSGTPGILSLASSFPAIDGHETYITITSGSLPAGVTLDPVGKHLIYDGTPGSAEVNTTLTSIQGAPKITFSNATGTIPVMFGIAFPKGAVSGALGASATGLRVVTRRTWNDGSVKHAVVCGSVDASDTVTFNTAPIPGKALTSASIHAAKPKAVVNLGAYGVVSLASLLTSPFETWISTDKMVECHYRGAFAGTDIAVEFHVRLWASGAMWIRVGVENSSPLIAKKNDYSLTGTVGIDGTTVHAYSATMLYWNTQHTFERWAGETQYDVVVNHDVKQLAMTKLVPNYGMVTTISETALNGLKSDYTVNANLGYEDRMGNGGFQNDIGLLPLWDAAFVVSGDSRACKAVLAHAKAAFSYAILFRHNGRMLTPGDYPNDSADGYHGGGNGGSAAGSLAFDVAHHPSMGYLAYLLTGDALAADVMLAVCATIYRGTSTIGGYGTARLLNISQTRSVAWTIRSLGQTTAILPDGSPELSDWKAWLETQIVHFKKMSVDDPKATNSELGYPATISTYDPAKPLTIAPWMHNFWIASMGYISDTDPLNNMVNFIALRDWMYRGIVGLLGDGAGHCYTYGSSYKLTVSDEIVPNYVQRKASQLYRTWAEVMQASHGAQSCGAVLLGDSYAAGLPYQAKAGLWGEVFPAISYAVDHAAAGANASYKRLISAGNWPDAQASAWSTIPIWGCAPRSDPKTFGKTIHLSIVRNSVALSITGSVWKPNRDGEGAVIGSDWQGLPLNTWLYVGTAVLNDVIETPHYLNQSGGDSSNSIINAWGGAAWDYINQRMFIAGGGHSDGSACETGIYMVDMEKMRFSRIRDRDPMSVIQCWDAMAHALVRHETWPSSGNAPLLNGEIGSGHSGYGILFVPPSVMENTSGGIFRSGIARSIYNLDTRESTVCSWFSPDARYFDSSNIAAFIDGSTIFGPWKAWNHWRYDLTQNQPTTWNASSFGKFETIPISQNKEVRAGGGIWGDLRERREEFSLSSSGALVRCRYGEAIDAAATTWNRYCDTITLTSSDGSHADFSSSSLRSEAMFAGGGSAYDHSTQTLYIQANAVGANLYSITGLSGNTWTTQKIKGTGALHASQHGDYGRLRLAMLAGKRILLRVTNKTVPIQVMRIS